MSAAGALLAAALLLEVSGPVDSVPMVTIGGGCLEVGCLGQARCQKDLAAPPRKVCLDPFRLDRTEVTVTAYRGCVAAGKCTEVAATDRPVAGDPRDRHPIIGVTWAQADAYCRFMGKRLPTEAEWERAAVGPSGDGRAFPWGPAPARCDVAVLGADSLDDCRADRPASPPYTRPPCSRPQGNSPEGLCDMIGNAAEWVSDFYMKAESALGGGGKNPVGPCPGQKRCPGAKGHIIKGGSWSDSELFARIHMRSPPWKPFVATGAGVRCAATVTK
jgi:formylglycine-generating enzyme